MDSKEFFKKMRNGEFEGENFSSIGIEKYFENPSENKVYNLSSKKNAQTLCKIAKSKSFLESGYRTVIPGDKYQVGIFYKKPRKNSKSLDL